MVISCRSQVQFRQRYNAVILAVHRGGEDITAPIREIVFERGDGLVVEAAKGFEDYKGSEQDLYDIYIAMM